MIRINDEKRRQWVHGDEGLYHLHRRSGKALRAFVRANRAVIDEVIRNIESGKKQQHYLIYG